jgi:hypothetical protein
MIEETKRQIQGLMDEVAQLSEQDLAPPDYYGELLKRLLVALAAPAGAVWLQTPQGHLQLQYQINMREVGLDQTEAARNSHNELLRQAFGQGKALHLPPHSSTGAPEGGTPAGNPTNYLVLLAPILVEKQSVGLLEIWQNPHCQPNAIPGFLRFLVQMAAFASRYTRNHRLRQMVGQQQLWTQLEAFARQAHGSLNPTEVSYVVANEGRRLIECDRLSVAIRHGKYAKVEAISGADVVETRSNLVKLMRELFDRVLAWGERLTYSGTRDETLPPDILKALDAYLAESNSKLLALMPLRDERESEESKKPCRSALLMECFEPAASSEQLLARCEVVGRHATSALYNAAAHHRIPMRFIWQPLARLQDGLGGKTRAIIFSIAGGLLALLLALIVIPYPLKMNAKGQLMPEERRWVYSPVEGQVREFASNVEPGKDVFENQDLVLLYDVKFELQLTQLNKEIQAAQDKITSLDKQLQSATNDADRARLDGEKRQAMFERDRKRDERAKYIERTHSVEAHPGFFWLKAPMPGTILNSEDFRETLSNRWVKPSDPLLRIGDRTRDWEVELKIPQKHIGQILQAYATQNPDEELDVDLLLASAPTHVYKGKLARGHVGMEATPNKDDNNESDPVVLAWVRLDGQGIAENDRVPRNLRVTGSEVHVKIRCGTRPMGYSLFYGVWEWAYEKIVFWF